MPRDPLTVSDCRAERVTFLDYCKGLPTNQQASCVQFTQKKFHQCVVAAPLTTRDAKERAQVSLMTKEERAELPAPVKHAAPQQKQPAVKRSCKAVTAQAASQQKRCTQLAALCARKPHNRSASCRTGASTQACNDRLNHLQEAMRSCR